MSEITKNTFEGGMNQDIEIALSKGNSMLYAENIRILSGENTNYIVTNLKGSEVRSSLSPGYWCKGVEVTNGVAYIVSAEIINGIATGRGEIGCFPSPDYSTGNITADYRPFMNYKGDQDQFPDYNGPLNSSFFNFQNNVRIEIEIQQEYDGTVNVVFTDGINPLRILNSSFAKRGGKYVMIDRTGVTDSNKYSKESWSSTMALIQGFSTLSQVEFIRTEPGGEWDSGNSTFYIRYTTLEGNKSEIICQTFPISIYSGTSISGSTSIKGGVSNSDKSVVLKISGLDTSYGLLHIDYSLEGKVSTGYKSLTNSYPFSTTELEITFTGLEPSTDVSEEEVGLIVTAFDYAKSITQIQNRLVIANIGKAPRKITTLREFAAFIVPKFKEIPIDANYSGGYEIFNVVENLETKSIFGDGRSWNIGYANNKNSYLRRGYWGGETYSFGVRFVYKDLTVSPVFPTFGYDDKDGTTTHTLTPTLKSEILSLLQNGSGFSNTDTKNVNGTYRFPTRTCTPSNSLSKDNGVNTYAVTFDIPNLSTTLTEGSLLDEVVGIEFVRSERIKDCLFQGVGLACYPFQTQATGQFKAWNNIDRGDFTSVMPLIKGILPASWYSSRHANSKHFPTGSYTVDFVPPQNGLPPASFIQGDSINDGQDAKQFNILMHQGQPGATDALSQAGTIVNGINVKDYTGIYSPELISNYTELSPFINGSVALSVIRQGRLYGYILNRDISSTVENTFPNEGLGTGNSYNDLINYVSPQLFIITSTNKTGATSPISVNSAAIIGQDVENLNNFKSFLQEERFMSYPIVHGHYVSNTYAQQVRTGSYWGVKGATLLEDLYGYAAHTCSPDRNITLNYYNVQVITPTIYNYINVGYEGGPSALTGLYNLPLRSSSNLIFDVDGEYFNFFNVYKGTGLTSWDTIKLGYTPSVLKYTPISQRLFLTTGQRNAIYDASLESSESTFSELYYDDSFNLRNSLISSGNVFSKKPTFWGGDCYISPYFIKVARSSESNRGVFTSVLLESSVNAILLDESDNYPYDVNRLDVGADNMSEEVNTGYLKTISKVPYNSLDFNAPFIKVEFDTRVYYSDLHVQNNFKNAYKVFGLASYRDYTKHLGPITKVVNIKNTLFLIQRSGISVIPFNERITEAESLTGSIYLAQSDILSQYVVTYSEVYGTDLQFSCIPTSDNLYVLDLHNFKLICLTASRGVEVISDLKLESFLRKHITSFVEQEFDFTQVDIVGFDHTTVSKEVVWTFYDKSNPSKSKNISLAYNTVLRTFTSFYSMVPYQTFAIDGIQYAFNSKINPETIHSLETNLDRGVILEEAQMSIIRFKVSDKYELEKVFDNISIISNNILPDNVVYYVDGGNTNQTINYDPINIHLSNAKHREGVTYITIPRVLNNTNLDVTEYLEAIYTNAISQLNTVDINNERARFKGKAIVIELQFSSDKQIKLNSVLTHYRISNS